MKLLNCPKCSILPEQEFKFDRKNAVRYICPNCRLTKKFGWVYEDVEWCAADEAAKDWNMIVKIYEKNQKKEDSGNV